MAKFNSLKVYSEMESTGIVPVYYHSDVETARKVLKSCYEGGIRVFEFTNRGDFAHEVFVSLIKWAEKECPEMIIGAGSVVDPMTAIIYMQSGANFIVGPLFNPEVAKMCNRRLIPYIPGCASATEIGVAQESGAHIVKIFPADSVGGPSFVKSIKAPMPWTNIMVTGGVEPTEENLTSWFRSGVMCVGIGSNLFPVPLIRNNDWNGIRDICKKAISVAGRLKN